MLHYNAECERAYETQFDYTLLMLVRAVGKTLRRLRRTHTRQEKLVDQELLSHRLQNEYQILWMCKSEPIDHHAGQIECGIRCGISRSDIWIVFV